ncbi:hypothetical protein BGZ95_010331 [Linnemannia exigua]|uniref:Uncharacterized protein n=1 Tax=Linnemannia exigua TaxID=604196 RepID=A0AAD4DBT3_9FUNG|nr:hypothetical protein BGZ95_010331 [Linnemannia exigua]
MQPAFQKDRRQSRSTHLATKYMPSLPANATEFHMPVRIATRSSSAPAETRPISSQPPMTALRSSGLKLDLTTLQPWIDAAVRQPMSSMPSFLGETSKSYAAATTTAIATTTTPLAISPPESVYSLAKTIDAAYIKASSLLTHAMSLTSSSLVEQADAIRYHAVAQHVFEQELRMTESQWRTLFSHELVDGKRPAESFQTPTRPPDQVSAKTRSSLYSSFSPFLAYSRTPSPTSPSPPSRPSRSSMMTPLITARGDIGETGPVRPAPWPSSMGFENELTQPSIYAHHRQGDTAPTPPPPLQQPSVQTLEPLVAPCVAMLFDTVISTTTDRSSANKAFLPARLDALRENEQQLRQSDHNGGPQGQQHGMPQCQHQQDCLTATLFATPKAQLEDNNQQQRDHWQPQEEEMGHLKATAAMTGKVEQKGKPTSSEEVGGADWMTSQLSEARWNRVKERSTELYHKAIKSFEISARAHRVSQESHFQYDKLVRRWKVMGDMGDAQELEDWEGDGKERSTKS